ncbi:MAG: methyltransferase domain-containing protein [Candidatus Aenigmatarchaeota archaeon]
MSLKQKLVAAGFKPEHVPGGFQVIGDVLLVKFPRGERIAAKEKMAMAEAMAEILPKIRAVAEMKKVSGELRKPKAAMLFSKSGRSLETIHTEHGIKFKLDPSKVMFSKGNLAERARLASHVKPQEVIVDMFAGIGYFSLGIAKREPKAEVIAIEKNPIAFRYLKENIRLNGIRSIRAICGDCRKVNVRQKADRVIMGYFPGTERYLSAAFRLLKPRGIIHYHNIYHDKQKRERPVAELEQAAERAGYKLVGVAQRIVKSYAPRVWHVAVDAEVESGGFKTFYDRTAGIYDARQQNPWTARLREAELALIGKYAKGKVLDVGCGTGFHLAWLAKNKPECKLIGCDLSAAMLEAARKSVPSAELVEGNAERLPFPDGSFDTVLCMFATLNQCSHQAALSEMNRVLRPGGHAILSVSSVYDMKGSKASLMLADRCPPSNGEKPIKRIRIESSLLRLRLFRAPELAVSITKAGFRTIVFDSLFRSIRPRWGDWSSVVEEDLRQPVERGAMYLYVLEKN